MFILDKPLTPPPRRSRRRLIIIASILVVLLLVLFVFTDIPADIAFIVYFVTAPNPFPYHGHSDYVSAVAWSTDGMPIASASAGHTVQVSDAATGSHPPS